MKPDLLPAACESEAIFAARANLFRAPLVEVRGAGCLLHEFTPLYGACPLKVIERMGFQPVRALVFPGRLGPEARPDRIVIDVQ